MQKQVTQNKDWSTIAKKKTDLACCSAPYEVNLFLATDDGSRETYFD